MTVKNLCTNPSAKVNTTGWTNSSATFVRSTSLTGMPRTTGIKTTGGGFIWTPPGAVAPGDLAKVSFYIKNSTGATIAGGKQVFIGYTLSAGGPNFPGDSFNTAALGVDGNVQRASYTTAAAPALATGVFMLIDSLPADIDITAVMFEVGSTLNPYGDGDTSGWVWDGASGNSSSQEAPAAGFTVTVWNGSTEDTVGSVTVWDGASEDAASFDSVV